MSKFMKKFSLLDTRKNQIPFKRNHFLHAMMTTYFIVFIILSIKPVNTFEWWYESIIPLFVIVMLGFLYTKNRLTNTAYFCILTVLVLHAVGAHFTYAACPIGAWISRFLGMHRNHFDRVVNFVFGLLISIPVLESIYYRLRIRYIGACMLSVIIILAAAALYEIFELFSAMFLSEGRIEIFMGFQGDLWDCQKDMALAILGAFISMCTCIILRINKNHKIYMVKCRKN
ncbi:DUF2238 domain-containing protein [Ruminiclostridium papyrosolvens]|uniref:Membrane protein n=1 Tax=Ruminiclostridium papyrosolvens C7 TaxID=1330534 RepID=U4R550_9FIRM|nr:DUF2238 domain-containing protein [Ruminiclostridium papyrosolvens]EPR13679.1 membrane protein [Ruminiclostridium papyrosolvens C7]